jgi:hypothetical protein
MRNVLHIVAAHDSLSQSRLMDHRFWIIRVNGYKIKTFDKSHTASAQGRGRVNLVCVARQIGGLLRLDVKFAGM